MIAIFGLVLEGYLPRIVVVFVSLLVVWILFVLRQTVADIKGGDNEIITCLAF